MLTSSRRSCMRTYLSRLFVLLCGVACGVGNAQLVISWTPMGPVGVTDAFGQTTSGKLQTFAASLSAPNTLYAGGGLGPGNQDPLSEAGALRGHAGGQPWKPVNTGFLDPVINKLWVDPDNPN